MHRVPKPTPEEIATLSAYVGTKTPMGAAGAAALVAHMKQSHRFAYSISDPEATYHIYCRFGGLPTSPAEQPSDIRTWSFREHGFSSGMRPESWEAFETLAATFWLGPVCYRYR